MILGAGWGRDRCGSCLTASYVVLVGETLDPGCHETRVDVKAVTLHRFALERTGRGWEATVVLDIRG